MRYIRMIFIISIFVIYPATSFAQSMQTEAERWATIRFLNKQEPSQRLLITLKNHQMIEGTFDKTFYDYFVVWQNGVSRDIQFSDVEKITTPRKRFKILKLIVKIPLYAVATVIGAPGAIIFLSYCAIDPNHCK